MATDFSNLLDGRVLGGDQGEGVLIEQIVTKEGDKKGVDEAYIEIMGTAKTVLRDSYNPMAGWDELPEPIPVTERVKVLLADKEADNKILYDRLSKEFKIDPPLEDKEGEWERFLDGAENSVYSRLVGGRIYFQAKKNATKTGESASHYFYNVVNVAKRKAATVSEGGASIKAMLAKKKAKAAPVSNFSVDD